MFIKLDAIIINGYILLIKIFLKWYLNFSLNKNKINNHSVRFFADFLCSVLKSMNLKHQKNILDQTRTRVWLRVTFLKQQFPIHEIVNKSGTNFGYIRWQLHLESSLCDQICFTELHLRFSRICTAYISKRYRTKGGT